MPCLLNVYTFPFIDYNLIALLASFARFCILTGNALERMSNTWLFKNMIGRGTLIFGESADIKNHGKMGVKLKLKIIGGSFFEIISWGSKNR